eukprot:gene316-9409_t
MAHILSVSHRWAQPEQPDSDCTQLAAIREFVIAHPEIECI